MKRCLLVLVLAVWAKAEPGPCSLIANISSRSTTSLDGAWRAIVDPFDNGKSAGFFRNAKPQNKSDRVEYSFDASPVLNIPGDWNTQREQLMFYEGPVWYRREFSYRKRADQRVFLYFGAANYQTAVYLNGDKLGDHEGGFTAFNFEATSVLRDGDNFLIVEVSNPRRSDAVPALKYDWWNYGGITGNVSLVEVPTAFVQDYWVQLARGSQSEIAGWVQLNGAQSPQQVTLEIPEAHLRETFTTDAAGRAAFHFPTKLDLWSPEHPKL
jgi:beta-glucuronidase